MATKRRDTKLIDNISQEIYNILNTEMNSKASNIPYIALSEAQKSKYLDYSEKIMNIINGMFMMEKSKASLSKKISILSGISQKDIIDVFHSMITMVYINRINKENIETPYDVLLDIEDSSDSVRDSISNIFKIYGIY